MEIQNLTSWFLAHGIKIVFILIAANLINRFSRTIIKKTIEKQIQDNISEQEKKMRIETLITVFQGTLKFIIWVVALLMILPEFELEIAPILASVGVMGLAVGMAAKDIISDFIAGLFIILENQYYIGEKIKVAGVEGKVKEITLRKTVIESEDGSIHSIPNSKVTVVSKKQ
ncbi:MAG: mechanosensitive ion channel family protein [Patescibacteria group bacterium]|nr:mechanosensitive ion channel family protein [Patescibacteria group bacterium]